MSKQEKQTPENEREKTPVTPPEETAQAAAPDNGETQAGKSGAGEKKSDGKKDASKKEETFTLSKAEMEKLESLAKELETQKDQMLRLAAEYDNYRKRTAKEKEGIYSTAKIDTVTAMLPVFDNLERGIAGCEAGDPHKQGLELILKQFRESLSKLGVTEMDCQGKPFDPERMNAVMHVEDEAFGENTVAEVLQKGFEVGEKVLRFAMVKVAN